MTNDEVLGLSFIFNYLSHLTIKEVFKDIFLIDSKNVIRGFNKAVLRNYAKGFVINEDK